MARGGGKTFEVCPKCGKKGLYEVRAYPYDGSKECRYCYHKVPGKPRGFDRQACVSVKPE